MNIMDELDSMFSSVPETISTTSKSRRLVSRRSAAYSRSLIDSPDRTDLSNGEWTELCILRKRLRVDGFCTDFTNLCLEDTRNLAIKMQISTAIRCLN